MQQLLGEKAGVMDKSLLHELFLQRLPCSVRMVLASSPDSVGLKDLAQLADRILEVSVGTPPSVSALGPLPSVAEVERLRSEVASLKQLVKSLPRTTSHRFSRTTTPPPSHAPPTDVCWHHQRFGGNAKKCRIPYSSVAVSVAGLPQTAFSSSRIARRAPGSSWTRGPR